MPVSSWYCSCNHYNPKYNLWCENCDKHWEDANKPLKANTQKAKGVIALQGMNHVWAQCEYVRALPVKTLIKASEPLKSSIGGYLPAFCRPCPPNPEHGFVESKVVKTVEALEEMRQATLAANPDSEIMLTVTYPNVAANAIWTPNLLTIGPGNDGATAGKSTVSMPLSGMSKFRKEDLEKAGVALDKAPYVEVIFDKMPDGYEPAFQTILTQIRSGPILDSGVTLDYIPEEMTVTEVIQTNGEDLLEWAKVVRGLKGKTGVVVYHPGGSLVDHYSVHCRENGVPIVLTEEPKVGMVLASKPMADLDPQEIIRGLAYGSSVDMGKKGVAGGYVSLALMALHNSAALRGSHSFWIGLGVAAVCKLGSAAMRGEARHAHEAWKSLKNKPDIYAHYGPKSLSFHRAALSRVTQLLHYGFGDPDTQPVASGCGMGGRRWALCGVALAPLFTSIRRLVAEPTVANASQLLLDYNVAINQAHNGGWWLNKFISVASYDEIPKGNLGFIMRAAPMILKAGQERHTADLAKFTKSVLSWPEVTLIAPLRWRKADLNIGPGSLVISLKASTIPKLKLITIPASANVMKALVSAAGRIDISPGKVSLIDPEGTETVLFKETELKAESRVGVS
jgi:hypothetical protein